MLRPPFALFCAPFLCLLAGCGYHFQGSRNPLSDLGITRIYVAEFRNSSYRPGIEQYFTTAMVREIARSQSFQLVNSEKEADAVLTGTVSAAESVPGSAVKEFTVQKGKSGERKFNVATEYNAGVGCVVVLRDRRGRQLFAQSVADSKVHPGFVKEYDAGATGPLVNDSEQRLAVQFLASQMMGSVFQRMIDTF